MQDAQLSDAVFIYFGKNQRSGSFPGDVLEAWGGIEGEDLIRRIRLLVEEMFAAPPDWHVENLRQATQRVKEMLRERHPELSAIAVEVMGNYFAFEWK